MVKMVRSSKFLLLLIIIINVCVIFSFPVYGFTQTNDEKSIIDINSNFDDDSVLVVLTKEYSEIEMDYKETIFSDYSNDSIEELSINYERGEHRFFEITLPIKSKENVIDTIRSLEQTEGVLCASPNYVGQQGEVSETYLSYEQWALNEISGINLEKAWEFTKGSSNVKVGIIDSGFDFHEDITENLEENVSFLKYNEDGSIDETNTDIDINGDHGTKIAGIIGANHNSQGINGVCENVSIVPLVVDDYTNQIIKALEYCEEAGIRIVNMSLWNFPYSAPFEIAISEFDGLFICIAGNGDLTNIDADENYPASFECNNMIVVGALDSEKEIASFSNYGATSVDIYAPGENVLTTLPGYVCDENIVLNDGVRICELNYGARKSCYNVLNAITGTSYEKDKMFWLENAIATSNATVEDYSEGRKASTHVISNYHGVSGTSYAAPHVAGVAALLLSINPNLDIDDLKSAILDSADIIPITVPDTSEGSNDGDMTVQSVKKLNAFNAVKEVLKNYCSYSNYSLNNINGVVNMSRNTPNDGAHYGLNDFFKLSVPYEKNYEFTISSLYGVNAVLCDQNFNVISYDDLNSSNNTIQFSKNLNVGTYYLMTNFTNEFSSGDILTEIKFTPNLVLGNNNILNAYTSDNYDYLFTNNIGGGFYKITLNATTSSGTIEYPDGCLKVYEDETKQQLLPRLETVYYTLDAETQDDSNNLIVFLEYGQPYCINIDLPNDSYTSMNVNVERLSDTYDITESNTNEEHIILDGNTTAYGDFIQRIEVFRAGTYTISFVHNGPQSEENLMGQEDPLYLYYAFYKEVSSPAEEFGELEMIFPHIASSMGGTISFTFNLQPGIYYIGYYNKLNNQPMTISITS